MYPEFSHRLAAPILGALILTLLGSTAAFGANTSGGSPATIRIKAGSSEALKDETGVVWQAERGFADGDTIERGDIDIANTKTPSLYRSEHYGMTKFSLPVPNGTYTVKLHFAETFEDIDGPGQRVFSFAIGGKEFKDFDVFKKAGGSNRALVVSVPVEVKDGKVEIAFTPNIENPEINAIEIIPGGKIAGASDGKKD